jgi:hypothetical protein
MEEGAERAGRLWRRVWRAELRAPACFVASEQGVGGNVIRPRRRNDGVRSEQSSEQRRWRGVPATGGAMETRSRLMRSSILSPISSIQFFL